MIVEQAQGNIMARGAHDHALRPVRGLQGAGDRHRQQDRDPAGLFHAVWRCRPRPQPDRRPVQGPDPPARRGSASRSRSSTRPPPPTCGPVRPTNRNWASPTKKPTSCCSCWSTSATARRNASKPGFEPKFVETVVKRIRRNHFKRVMPPVAKITTRTVGYDFLYLRDWGT